MSDNGWQTAKKALGTFGPPLAYAGVGAAAGYAIETMMVTFFRKNKWFGPVIGAGVGLAFGLVFDFKTLTT